MVASAAACIPGSGSFVLSHLVWRRIPLQAGTEPSPRYGRSRPARRQSERKRSEKKRAYNLIHHLPDEVTTMNKAAGRQSDEEGVSRWKLAVSGKIPSSSTKSQGQVGADEY